MKKLYIVALILLVASCGFNKKQYKQLQQRADELNTHCSIYNNVDKEVETLWVGTMFYDSENTNLNQAQRQILKDVSLMRKTCGKKIALIAYSSDKEAKGDTFKSYTLASNRIENAFKYLVNQDEHNSKTLKIICDSEDSFLQSENSKSYQRVDIVLLSISKTKLYYSCLNY